MPNPTIPSTVPSKAATQRVTTGKVQQPSAQVNEYVSNGMQVIHSPETRDNIVSQLKTGDDPAMALAQTTVNVLNQLDTTSTQAGADVTPETVLQGASPIMEQIMEIGEASGVIQLSEDQVKQAAGMAVSLYIKKGMETGKITMENMQNLYDSSKEQVAKEAKEQPVVPAGGTV